jgi:hypothetical protein
MFYVLKTVRKELQAMVRCIGEKYTAFQNAGMSIVNEMVWIFHRVLVERTSNQAALAQHLARDVA